MDIPAIDVTDLSRALDAGARLVDVRQPAEWSEVRAPGAELVPLDEIGQHLDEFGAGERVYVICRSGGRSAKAAELLRSRDVDAVNVTGGTLAWIDAGLPVDGDG